MQTGTVRGSESPVLSHPLFVSSNLKCFSFAGVEGRLFREGECAHISSIFLRGIDRRPWVDVFQFSLATREKLS